MNSTFSSQRGASLIEACIAMAVTAVLASNAAPSMRSFVENRRIDGVATQLATDIQYVRTLAVARNEPVRLTVRALANGSCYIVHTGNADQCACTSAVDTAPAQCSGGARQIKTVRIGTADQVALDSNVASVLFDPLHGTSSPTGTLRVRGASGRTVQHVINVMGRVRSCSPAAAVPGWRAC